jgi:hypothetical protein
VEGYATLKTMFRLRVKEVLLEKKTSVSALSRGADIPIALCRRLKNDQNYIPSSYTLFKAARYLGVSMDSLCYEDKEAPPT